jgi:WASH complex subunit 7
MMSVYKQIYDLVRKLMSYVEHTIVQVHCMFNRKEAHFKQLFKNMNLYMPLEIMGKALRLIYLVDTIVNNSSYIKDHWNLYKRLVVMARSEPDKFGMNLQGAKRMEKLTRRLDNTIMSGRCFDYVISLPFDKFFEVSKSELGNFKSNKDMREFMELYFEENAKKLV